MAKVPKKSPYKIATLENLYWIAANKSNWDKHYIQTTFIDASLTRNWFEGKGWVPIRDFTGSYNGNNYAIDGLYINRPDESIMGLFGYIEGTVSNIIIANLNISGNEFVGGLAGYNNEGNIINSYSTGFISGNELVGGLVGANYKGNINKSYSKCSINGIYCIGGLVGWNRKGTVNNSCFAGSI